jgi:hypothetical protein
VNQTHGRHLMPHLGGKGHQPLRVAHLGEEVGGEEG